MDTWSGQPLGPRFLEIILPLLPSPWSRKTEIPQGDFLRGPAGVRMSAVLRVSASVARWGVCQRAGASAGVGCNPPPLCLFPAAGAHTSRELLPQGSAGAGNMTPVFCDVGECAVYRFPCAEATSRALQKPPLILPFPLPLPSPAHTPEGDPTFPPRAAAVGSVSGVGTAPLLKFCWCLN